MSIVGRMVRLVKADVHGLLDLLEEPEVVLKQALRDMDQVIAEEESKLTELNAERESSERRSQRFRQAIEGTHLKIERALGAADDKIARSMVRRKLELERALQRECDKLSELKAQTERVDAEITRKKEKLEELREKVELFVAPRPGEARETAIDDPHAPFVSDDEVDAVLAELKRQAANVA